MLAIIILIEINNKKCHCEAMSIAEALPLLKNMDHKPWAMENKPRYASHCGVFRFNNRLSLIFFFQPSLSPLPCKSFASPAVIILSIISTMSGIFFFENRPHFFNIFLRLFLVSNRQSQSQKVGDTNADAVGVDKWVAGSGGKGVEIMSLRAAERRSNLILCGDCFGLGFDMAFFSLLNHQPAQRHH